MSYVGVDATPGYILSQNGGVARPAYGWGGSKYISTSFDTAMNNPLCGKQPVITCSNKLRTYTTARYYSSGDILEMITGGAK